jgi:ParB family chromosome partitioning protein
MILQINKIRIGERFRKSIETADLEQSISMIGLIQPIVVDENNNLVAGHRRLTACQRLGWDKVPVYVWKDVEGKDETERQRSLKAFISQAR